jgi:preprotein translocase subunit Sec61beta
LALLVLFFNPWLTVGVAINVAVIVVLAQTDWPVVEAFGW